MSRQGIIGRTPHLPVLTGLRFVAAFSVLLAHGLHAIFRNEDTSLFIHQFALQLAYLGLTLFFVLSGCVLTLNYFSAFELQPLRTLKDFWIARIARLYPLYLFCCILFLAFSSDIFSVLFKILPWNIFLMQAWTFCWVDGIAPRALYFFPYAWSISAEMFLYLLMPIIVWMLIKSKSYLINIIIFLVFYLTTILMLFFAYHEVVTHGHTKWLGIEVVSTVQFLQWISYYSPFPHISSFFAGCIVGKFLLNNNARLQTKYGLLISIFMVCIYFSLIVFIIPPDSQHSFKILDLPKHGMIYSPFVALLILVLAKYQNFISNILSHSICQKFGETSFSIYLLHPLIAGLFSVRSESESLLDPAQWLRLIIIIFFTIVISYGTYSLIEMPGRRWLRKKLLSKGELVSYNTELLNKHLV